MKTIHHVIDVGAGASSIYEALTKEAGLSAWWSSKVAAPSSDVGALIEFTFAGDFNPVMRIDELDADALVVWKCVGGHEPWDDNDFRFELAEHEGGTRLRFWQEYATELSDDAYGTYNFNWGYYLESLRQLCVEGQGKPFGVT